MTGTIKLTAKSTVTGQSEEVTSTAGALNTSGGGGSSASNITQTGGNALVNDDAAAGTTAPVPAGTEVNSSPKTYTTGDRGTVQSNLAGGIKTTNYNSAGTELTANANGRAAAASSTPVVLSTEDLAALVALMATPVVNAANSSTANLAGAAAFTGTSVDVTLYGSMNIYVYSSHVSATNGLSVQQSNDGTNWFITDTYTVAATTAKQINISRQARFFRVVYTNGATLTTTLIIQTILNPSMPRASSQRPGDAMSLENDFDLNYSVDSVYNGTTSDLLRSVLNGTNSVGTGILAAGLVAQFDDTSIVAPTENSFGNVRMTPNHSLIEWPFESPTNSWQYAAAAAGLANSTTAVTIKAAAAAGLRNYITGLQISWPTLGAATEIAIRDGAAGTVIWRGSTGTVPGQINVYFPSPIRGTAATLLEVLTLTATVTGGVYVSAQGFIAA